MIFKYFVLFITLKNIICFPTKRESPFSTNLKHLKPLSATPARYQTLSKNNYDPADIDDFPTIGHPSSVVDANTPFYLSSNPFSDEVTSLFTSLTDRKPNAKPTIDYTKKAKAAQKEKLKKQPVKPKTDFIKAKKPKTLHPNVKTALDNHAKDDEQTMEIEEVLKTLFTGSCTECDDVTYVIELINDIDTLMKTINHLEEECKKDNTENATANEKESSNDTPVSTVVVSDEPSTDSNGNSVPTQDNEQEPLFMETDDNVDSAAMINDGNTTDNDSEDPADDLQVDRSGDTTINEDNDSSCDG